VAEDIKRNNDSVALATIGRRIQIARNKRRLTVARLSAKTAISTRFIEYIEAGEFNKLPGRSYALGFTRSICRELSLDPDEFVQALKSELYPHPITQFDRSMGPYMTRSLIAEIATTFKSALNAIIRSKHT